jgi:hypothetical protein
MAVFWFTTDLADMLRALNAANAAAARIGGGPLMEAYRQGYNEAMVSLALALGVNPAAVGLKPQTGGAPKIDGRATP